MSAQQQIHAVKRNRIPMTFGPASLFLALFIGLLLNGCKKDDVPVVNIEARLYSITTSLEDPGIECELFGNIWSVPEVGGKTTAHDHFQHSEDSYFEIGLKDTYIFSESPISVKTWQGVEETGVMKVRIKLFEDDIDLVDSDDSFGDKTFEFPVSEIISGIDPATGYIEKSGLTVYSGTESISITFRFKIP